jgi:hypothetical protein
MRLPRFRDVLDLLRRTNRGGGGMASQSPTRDGGWVQVLNADGVVMRGRGRLVLWQVPAADEAKYAARIESFAATGMALQAGESILVRPESGGEHGDATVADGEPGKDQTTLNIVWHGGLPVSLRELGGSHLSH